MLVSEGEQAVWLWGQEGQDPTRPAPAGLNCFHLSPWEHELWKMTGLREWNGKSGVGERTSKSMWWSAADWWCLQRMGLC